MALWDSFRGVRHHYAAVRRDCFLQIRAEGDTLPTDEEDGRHVFLLSGVCWFNAWEFLGDWPETLKVKRASPKPLNPAARYIPNSEVNHSGTSKTGTSPRALDPER